MGVTVSALQNQVNGSHYKDMPIQPVEFIYKNDLDFLQGNVAKYVCRFRSKNGKDDLLKAKHFIEMLIELEYGEC